MTRLCVLTSARGWPCPLHSRVLDEAREGGDQGLRELNLVAVDHPE